MDHIESRKIGGSNVVVLKPRADLFENETILSLESRALAYLRAGAPIHLRGPAGTGKTTLALQLAAKLGRPAIIITGDGWLTSGNLVGREVGSKTRQVVDRYIHNVHKTETETSAIWAEDVLTQAITGGHTLIYDEFTRSPPQANNPLLSAFEERMLILPGGQRRERYVRAHPDFRAILTSNPQDYAGVMAPQDALVDRMITFDLDDHDRDTEVGIVANRSGISKDAAGMIVDLIRALRGVAGAEQAPSLRSAIMIGRVSHALGLEATAQNMAFVQLCLDVLHGKSARGEQRAAFVKAVRGQLDRMAAGGARATRPAIATKTRGAA